MNQKVTVPAPKKGKKTNKKTHSHTDIKWKDKGVNIK